VDDLQAGVRAHPLMPDGLDLFAPVIQDPLADRRLLGGDGGSASCSRVTQDVRDSFM
jgi:hypothetical protein